MAEIYKLYLDQMFHLDVAKALLREGYDVLRARYCCLACVDTSLHNLRIILLYYQQNDQNGF